MINALASSDGDFNSSDMMGGQQPNLTENAALLKTTNTDVLNKHNFANYLSEARSGASPTTEMINLQISKNINSKVRSMTLQLTPLELGKLDIKLNFANDGSVKAHLIVEKPETLALLQKDAHYLEKVLQDTGLSTNKDSLSFDLKQQSSGQENLGGYNDSNKDNEEKFATYMDGTAADEMLQAQIAIEAMGYITQSGVNIRV